MQITLFKVTYSFQMSDREKTNKQTNKTLTALKGFYDPTERHFEYAF